MFEEEDPPFDCISYGENWNIEHPDDRDDELHREGGIPHWQGMVFYKVQNTDVQQWYSLDESA